MVLHHVGVSHEVKLVIGKRQALSSNVALLIINSVIGSHLLKSFRGRSIVHRGRVQPKRHCVYGECTKLSANIQNTRSSTTGRRMIQNIAQDLILSPTGPNTCTNPIAKIRRNSRIARDHLENLFQAFQSWTIFQHSRETEVYTSRQLTEIIAGMCLVQRFRDKWWRDLRFGTSEVPILRYLKGGVL